MKIVFLIFITTYCLVEIDAAKDLTDKLRLATLNTHNKYRSTVALGKALNKNGTTLPKATNMYKLTWSKKVEKYAQEHANKCNLVHSYVHGTSNNLWVIASAKYQSLEKVLNQSVFDFYNELKKDGQSSLTLDGTNNNHFTQVVWSKTKEIGCAVNYCPKMTNYDTGANAVYTFVVCDYSPAGNVRHQNIYTSGAKSASHCPTKSVANNKTGLCEIKGRADIHA